MSTLIDLKEAVVKGKRKIVNVIVPELLEAGVAAKDILEEALIPAMAEIGERFKRNEVYVPEMLVAARAMKEGMLIIEPHLISAGIRPEFKALICTVEGDLHDIGKNLVAIMWKGAGFEVIDLGVSVSKETVLEAIQQHQPHILGLSALLTTTMPAMREVVSFLRAKDIKVKIMVGGAPVTQSYAEEIGADAYSSDAASAVDVAKRLLAS
jgi:5-methyltetrahydrofolate--homocysteine methyltransferase